MNTVQVFSRPHHCLKAMSLEDIGEPERQAETTLHGQGSRGGGDEPQIAQAQHTIFSPIFSNILPNILLPNILLLVTDSYDLTLPSLLQWALTVLLAWR